MPIQFDTRETLDLPSTPAPHGKSWGEIFACFEIVKAAGDGDFYAAHDCLFTVAPEHLGHIQQIDAHYGTTFATTGFQPDITIAGFFANEPARILMVDSDGHTWHCGDRNRVVDTAKGAGVAVMGHALIRMRDIKLGLLGLYSLTVTPINFRKPETVKNAVNALLVYLEKVFGDAIAPERRTQMARYRASPEVQNSDAAWAFYAAHIK